MGIEYDKGKGREKVNKDLSWWLDLWALWGG